MLKASNTLTRHRKRRAVAFAAALLLGLSATAKASVIENLPIPSPDSAPFRPYLEEGAEVPLCQALLGLAEDAFFSRAYAVDIRGKVPKDPRYKFITWPFTDDGEDYPYNIIYRSGSNQVLAVFDEAALTGKGLVIGWAQWSHSWRGQNHLVQTFSSLEAFRKALGPVVTEERGSARQFDGGIGLSLNPWFAPTLIEKDERFFILEGYHDDERRCVAELTLSPITIEGKGEPLCRIRLGPQDAFIHGPESVARLFDHLDLVTGEDCGGGTLHSLARLKLLIEGIPSRVLLRPWAMTTEPYNSKSTVDLWLNHWSEQDISQAITYEELLAARLEARRELQLWYQSAFGFDTQAAANASAFAVDWLLRGHFKFPRRSNPTGHETDSLYALKRAILSGANLDRISNELEKAEASNASSQDILSEVLPNALALPLVLDYLIAEGAELDHGNAFNKTALMFAAHFDLLEAAEILLDAGADPNRQTRMLGYSCPYIILVGERTALFYAAEKASADMIRLLIERGAEVTAVDSRGFGALQYLELNEALSPREREELKALLRPN